MICNGLIAMMALDYVGTGYGEINRATAVPRASLEVLTGVLNCSLGTVCSGYLL